MMMDELELMVPVCTSLIHYFVCGPDIAHLSLENAEKWIAQSQQCSLGIL